MAYLIDLPTNSDERGSLTVIEKIVPFQIKRVYYIYNNTKNLPRARHRHKKTVQATICIKGSVDVYNNDGTTKLTFRLDSPSKCLILEPQDWHIMHNFSEDAILLVLASTEYDRDDYIHEEYS
ncbi:MAG: FdtA/QdtA family cupin domain-containing protein [Ignavibacteriales bacterium]|jgi:WxcM-like, C-terminal.|nr:MAG: WxcM-like domain-containing protein [Ignavibacteriaceae bacterium]MBW7872667.1 FdtA/QdtA family cupin domain-containing protein [Ignavibacteria bacterium]MCZ2143388.1 FdtA/QdtA family cupin domain-containing protein [Ignavibacteriales bacterium]MBV6444268.1 TDP-4-oxo-6-deoxy-alpha-D-glucose-3,4-oxoisomerase [Ignavibacteriaceae bacterium]MBZ0197768.1 FdtA/QdtA family cupin domain-containing protein [Ignavibacteriaceae bacterium]